MFSLAILKTYILLSHDDLAFHTISFGIVFDIFEGVVSRLLFDDASAVRKSGLGTHAGLRVSLVGVPCGEPLEESH